MSNKLNRIYIGAICNRDLEIFQEIKKFCSKNYNISIINLFKPGSDNFNVKYFKKKLKRYPISLIILKLLSEESNHIIYNAINEFAPDIPLLNSQNSVKICESRIETFNFIKQKCRKLNIPQIYHTYQEAKKAFNQGKNVIIKLNTHNIPSLPKNDRILGIAKNLDQFKKLTAEFKSNNLFFQEYLGEFDIMYKIYVIDRWAVSITSFNRKGVKIRKEIRYDYFWNRLYINKRRNTLYSGRK